MRNPLFHLSCAALVALSLAAPAAAETEFSFYGGLLDIRDSDLSGDDPGGAGPFDVSAGWNDRPFEMPQYGLRGTWWAPANPNLGFGLDLTRMRMEADDATRAATGFSRLEFDGLNTVTANVWYRWPGAWAGGTLTPYVGAGAGVAIPNVDVETPAGLTTGTQVSGPVAQVVAGVKYNINENWAVFGEYKGSYASHDIDLTGGGSLQTDTTSNAINVGVSFSF